jgi:hypothetical protein
MQLIVQLKVYEIVQVEIEINEIPPEDKIESLAIEQAHKEDRIPHGCEAEMEHWE